MKALMKTAGGVGKVRVQHVPTPSPGQGEVLIRVQVACVCGTDVHIYYDRFANSPPIILGHEFSGVIESIGTGVEAFRKGDRVVSANNPFACGACAICKRGYPNMCPQKKAMGIHSDGCFAEYVKLPANLIHRIPDNISFEEASLMEPLAVATHAVSHRCSIEQGDTVVVFGPGAIGILAAQVARAENAKNIVLVGTTRDEAVRFACADELGLETLNIEKVGKEGLQRRIDDLTAHAGADVVVEASGSTSAIACGLEMLRKNGRMAISGITGKTKLPIAWDQMVSKAVSLFFCYSSINSDWEKALDLLADKKVQTLPLITHRFELEQWKDAFDKLEKLEAVRPVFQIGA